MTFNQLKYFTTLAESKSFTEAARCLFITQPALSRQIQAMEEELGVELLFRQSRTFKLTPSGSILYKRFSEILESYDTAIDEAMEASKGYDGALTVAILDIIDVSELFPAVVRRMHELHPNLELSMKRGSLKKVIQEMNSGNADIIFTYGFSLYDQPDLITFDIDTFNSCIMLPKSHPLADKKDISLSDFKDDTFYQLKPSICQEGARFIDSLWERAGIHPASRWVDSMRDIMLWVETGSGVSITSDCSTEKNNPNVVIRPLDMPEAKGHDLTFAWKKDNYNPAIALFMQCMEHTHNK